MQLFGIGVQFGGKYFCHDVRVVRAAAARGLVPGGAGRLVLGGPAGARQDHVLGCLPGSSSRPTPRSTCPTPAWPRTSRVGRWWPST